MRLTINEQRFLNTFTISSSIGTTDKGGLHRLALSNEDKQMRDIFKQWMEEDGLSVRIDDFGNMYGRREGKLKDAPAVAFGSHLDTQPTGGRFDGILGVLSALEVIRVLNDEQYMTDYPLEIINFTNEEGARFRPPMLGSGGVAEVFDKNTIYSKTDDNGHLYEEALEAIGYKGNEENRLGQIKNFVELHIEQGPILEKEEKDIGIVSGIQGMNWFNIEIKGATNHAGPTPMDSRKDSLAAAAEMIVRAHALPNQFPGLLTTVGKVDNYPNVVNVVSGHTTIKLDIRHPNDQVREAAIAQFKSDIEAIAASSQVQVGITEDWDSPTVHFDDEVLQAIETASNRHGYSIHTMFSGPGHDAKYMSYLGKTAMIFVKSIDGVSHNEKELTLEHDLVKGTNVLLDVVLQLANQKYKEVKNEEVKTSLTN